MTHYLDISASRDKTKILLKPIMNHIFKCTLIIAISLMFSFIAAFVNDTGKGGY